MDEKVLGRSTATGATASLRSRDEKQATLTSESAPSLSKAKKQLNIRNVSRIDSNSQAIAGDASVVVVVRSDKTQ